MKTPIEGKPGWVRYERMPGEPLSDEVKANLEELARMPEREIDTSDIPEWTEEQWQRAVRGRDVLKHFRPIKEALSIRLDSDVVAWLKKDGAGYQTRANKILRERMMKDLEGR